MVLQLHGHPMSTCYRRVLVVAAEMGLHPSSEFETVVHEFSEVYSPEWKTHQPFGQMPYLVDTETGFEIYESRAIARYLAAKQKSPLVPNPSDLAAYGNFEKAASLETANFDQHAATIAYELVFAKMFGQESNQALAEAQKAKLAKRLEGYEAILSKQAYLAGDKLSAADLFHLPYGQLVADIGAVPSLTDGSLPAVKKWFEGLRALESWKKANEDNK